jgi:hypothetical protein
MSADAFEVPLPPVVRQVEAPQPLVEAPKLLDNVHVALPSQEHAQAVERAFASHHRGDDALGNVIGLASVGMLLHDIVSDTLAEPEEEDEEEAANRDQPEA